MEKNKKLLLMLMGKRRKLAMTVTTTGAQTLTLQQITPDGGVCVVDWGDGTANSTIANGNTGTTTHAYAGAGTWTVRISNPHLISVLDLRDSKIVFNSVFLRFCTTKLATLYLSGLSAGCTINSADMAHLRLTKTLYMYFTQAGTYAIDSGDFASYTLSYQLYLHFQQAGTYSIDSTDFASYTLSNQLLLYFSQAGTYAIDSGDFASYTLSNTLTLYFNQTGTYTISRADWPYRRATSIQIEMGLSNTQVNAILLGLADSFADRLVAGTKIDLLGNGNAAPTGAIEAPADPDIATWTAGNAAYELVNDTHGNSAFHWGAVEVAS